MHMSAIDGMAGAPAATDGRRLRLRLKEVGESVTDAWRTRLHRSISWLHRSEAETDDIDARFIFSWIAFNAAYAREHTADSRERSQFQTFFSTLTELDHDNRLAALMLTRFSGPVRVLIDNKYIFEPFWRALREHDSSNDWEKRFIASKKVALTAVMRGDAATVLSVVFDRLYVLRNQLVHGGATWNSQINRPQVRDGMAILACTVPVILDIMLEHPDADFGDIEYPVV